MTPIPYSSPWSRQVIWRSENPELFERIIAAHKEVPGCFGRFYWHGSLGKDETNQRYLESLREAIPVLGDSSYAQTVKEDLVLMKMAIARGDECLQMVDREAA